MDAFVAPYETLVQLLETNPGAFDITEKIVPDLPIESSATLRDAAQKHGIDLIFMLTPTSTEDRMNLGGTQVAHQALVEGDHRERRWTALARRLSHLH